MATPVETDSGLVGTENYDVIKASTPRTFDSTDTMANLMTSWSSGVHQAYSPVATAGRNETFDYSQEVISQASQSRLPSTSQRYTELENCHQGIDRKPGFSSVNWNAGNKPSLNNYRSIRPNSNAELTKTDNLSAIASLADTFSINHQDEPQPHHLSDTHLGDHDRRNVVRATTMSLGTDSISGQHRPPWAGSTRRSVVDVKVENDDDRCVLRSHDHLEADSLSRQLSCMQTEFSNQQTQTDECHNRFSSTSAHMIATSDSQFWLLMDPITTTCPHYGHEKKQPFVLIEPWDAIDTADLQAGPSSRDLRAPAERSSRSVSRRDFSTQTFGQLTDMKRTNNRETACQTETLTDWMPEGRNKCTRCAEDVDKSFRTTVEISVNGSELDSEEVRSQGKNRNKPKEAETRNGKGSRDQLFELQPSTERQRNDEITGKCDDGTCSSIKTLMQLMLDELRNLKCKAEASNQRHEVATGSDARHRPEVLLATHVESDDSAIESNNGEDDGDVNMRINSNSKLNRYARRRLRLMYRKKSPLYPTRNEDKIKSSMQKAVYDEHNRPLAAALSHNYAVNYASRDKAASGNSQHDNRRCPTCLQSRSNVWFTGRRRQLPSTLQSYNQQTGGSDHERTLHAFRRVHRTTDHQLPNYLGSRESYASGAVVDVFSLRNSSVIPNPPHMRSAWMPNVVYPTQAAITVPSTHPHFYHSLQGLSRINPAVTYTQPSQHQLMLHQTSPVIFVPLQNRT